MHISHRKGAESHTQHSRKQFNFHSGTFHIQSYIERRRIMEEEEEEKKKKEKKGMYRSSWS